MTFEEICAAIDLVTFRGGGWMVCVFQLDDLGDRVGLRLRYAPIDRDATNPHDTRETCIIESQDNIRSLASLDSPAAVADWAYEVVRATVLHELDEGFYVDDVRVRDPHA